MSMNRVAAFLFTCVIALTANTASAQSRRQSFKFTITPVDAKTHQPRSTFYLGEAVAVRVSLTNESRVARTVIHLQDATIGLKLSSMEAYESGPKIVDSY